MENNQALDSRANVLFDFNDADFVPNQRPQNRIRRGHGFCNKELVPQVPSSGPLTINILNSLIKKFWIPDSI